MKIAALVKRFNKEVELKHDQQDYTRTSVWLKALGVNPGAKVPAATAGRSKDMGIIPYLVHSAERVDARVEIDFS